MVIWPSSYGLHPMAPYLYLPSSFGHPHGPSIQHLLTMSIYIELYTRRNQYGLSIDTSHIDKRKESTQVEEPLNLPCLDMKVFPRSLRSLCIM